jgi:hypothetical protein
MKWVEIPFNSLYWDFPFESSHTSVLSLLRDHSLSIPFIGIFPLNQNLEAKTDLDKKEILSIPFIGIFPLNLHKKWRWVGEEQGMAFNSLYWDFPFESHEIPHPLSAVFTLSIPFIGIFPLNHEMHVFMDSRRSLTFNSLYWDFPFESYSSDNCLAFPFQYLSIPFIGIFPLNQTVEDTVINIIIPFQFPLLGFSL